MSRTRNRSCRPKLSQLISYRRRLTSGLIIARRGALPRVHLPPQGSLPGLGGNRHNRAEACLTRLICRKKLNNYSIHLSNPVAIGRERRSNVGICSSQVFLCLPLSPIIMSRSYPSTPSWYTHASWQLNTSSVFLPACPSSFCIYCLDCI